MFDIVYESCPWHTRTALFNDRGQLIALRYEDESHMLIEGAVVMGRVRQINKSLGAAFIDIGDVVDGFLSLDKLPKGMDIPHEGMALLVRIIRGREEDKGARLSADVLEHQLDHSRKPPFIVAQAPLALQRTLRDAGVSPIRLWILDARFRIDVLPYVEETKIYQLDQHHNMPLLDTLEQQLQLLRGSTFPLPSGGVLTIEYTKALISIDVDSGQAKDHDKQRLAYKTNLEAVAEIVRLTLLLNLSGSVVVDFISMSHKDNGTAITTLLKQQFAQYDNRRVQVLKMSRFGLLEFNRERLGERRRRLLARPSFVAGEILLKMYREKPPLPGFMVEAHPDVIAVLQKNLTSAEALAKFSAEVAYSSRDDFARDHYILSVAGRS